MEIQLKYGLNPNQKPARIYRENGPLPVLVLNGRPGYINFLDALNGWQLVSELRQATGLPAAASFKHVSPAGAAVGVPLDGTLKKVCFAPEGELSPLAAAYIRARGADRMSSFGDYISLSDPCDAPTARFIAHEVSDGIIAPGYSVEALEILKGKRQGTYNIIQIDPDYRPDPIERRQVFGITFEQGHNFLQIDSSMLENIVTENRMIPEDKKRDLLLALIALKYTQSNSVVFAEDGQTIGVGAGQQSRVHCTRLAGQKADLWHLRRHPKVLALPFRDDVRRPDRANAIDIYLSEEAREQFSQGKWEGLFEREPDYLTQEEKASFLAGFDGVCLASDAFFPFPDNIERAQKSGVRYIAQPGGSIRDDAVIEACNRYGMAMAFTGVRLFHH